MVDAIRPALFFLSWFPISERIEDYYDDTSE